MNEKIEMIRKIFNEEFSEESGDEAEAGVPGKIGIVQHGGYYGGIFNARKYMYSQHLIESLSIEKLESFIRNQIGI